MYEIKEIVLKNGPTEKKRLVIEFTDPEQQIIGEFLMSDVDLLHGKIVREINDLLQGKKDEVEFSGNRCFVLARKNMTKIEDLYADMEGMDGYPPYEMDTTEFLQLIKVWKKRQEEIQSQ